MTHSDPDRGHLLRNMVRFGRLLRAIGIKVTPTQIFELVGALDHVDIRHREDVKNTARTILISRHEHLALFDRAFDLFWQARKKGALLEIDLGALLQKLEKKEKLEEVPAPKDNDKFCARKILLI
jgi:uncharacterized protein with von Willebrand factor type A (vWA) domain